MQDSVHYFNPGYEASVADNLRYYTPPKMVRQLRRDLQCLPLYYATSDAKVFISSPLSEEWSHPQLVTQIAEGAKLLPWGWAPELEGLFGSALLPYTPQEMAYFCSRRQGAKLWHAVYRERPELFQFTPPQPLTLDFDLQGKAWVVKSDFTSSGRGVRLVTNKEELDKIVAKSRYPLFIEPFYKIIAELGLEYHYHKGEMTYLGYHQALTNKGQYIGSHLGPLSLEVDIEEYAEVVRQGLAQLSLGRYEGVIGVDTALYRWRDGSLHFVPCLEVNIRPTMGYVALSLAERYLQGRQGQFSIARQSPGLLSQLSSNRPLYLSAEKPLPTGLYPLTPILDESYFVALLQVF